MEKIMKKDRFDLEQDIMECWGAVDDIKAVTEYFVDSTEYAHMPGDIADAIMNKFFGIAELYEIKFKRLWDTFEDCIPAFDSGANKVDTPKDNGEVSLSYAHEMSTIAGYDFTPSKNWDNSSWDNLTYTIPEGTGDSSAITFTMASEDHDYDEQK